MIVLGKLGLPPEGENEAARKFLRSHFPTALFSKSEQIVFRSPAGKEIDPKSYLRELEKGVSEVFTSNRETLTTILLQNELYQDFVSKSGSDKDAEVPFFFSLAYPIKRIDGGEDGWPHGEYSTPLIPIDTRFVKMVASGEAPGVIRAFGETLLLFREEAVVSPHGELHTQYRDMEEEEYMSECLTPAEKDMLYG
jgi:hypothetical protein